MNPIEYWSVGGVSVRVEPVLTVKDLEIACDAALAGIGIARIPTLLCGEPLRDGRLALVFGSTPAMTRAIHAVYPSRVNLPTKVRFFLDALVSTTSSAPRSRGRR
jgi:DNA-binding transcriptional LysR family regulator